MDVEPEEWNPWECAGQLAWHGTQQQIRNPVSTKLEGKDWHLGWSSDLPMNAGTRAHLYSHIYTYICTHKDFKYVTVNQLKIYERQTNCDNNYGS